MALIKELRGKKPVWGKNCYFAETATIIGDVIMGDNCSVWFNTLLRGDVHEIRIGNQVNVQDGTIIHGTYQQAGTYIGDNVSIGHRAIIHGCRIQKHVLVGMGAIIMDHSLVQENTLIAAGSVVLENTQCESGYIYAGVPAKKIKKISPEVFKHTMERISENYLKYAGWYG